MFWKISLSFSLIVTSAIAGEMTKLESELEILRQAYVIPGMSAAMYQDGKLVEHAVSGIRKVGEPDLIRKDDKFHLGSCTKSMTATLAATFVEEGKLSWNTTLAELFPDVAIHPSFRDVTYEMLLSHGSGLLKDPDKETYIRLSALETLKGRQEVTSLYLGQAPTFAPQTYNYSNIGYIIAGHILERISGKSWEMLLQERIFIPLQMNSCGFGVTSESNEGAPTQPWGHYFKDWSIKPIQDDNAPFYGPSANVHCSISDWVKYLDIHVRGYLGEETIIKKESFEQLHRIWEDPKSSLYTFGGWFRSERDWANGDVLFHSGTNTYNFATVWLAPKTKTVLVSTANKGGYSGSGATSDAISAMIRLFIRKQ